MFEVIMLLIFLAVAILALIKGSLRNAKVQLFLLFVGIVLVVIGATSARNDSPALTESIDESHQSDRHHEEVITEDPDLAEHDDIEEELPVLHESIEPQDGTGAGDLTAEVIHPGRYIVGTDIAPGLYKSEGDIYYWARLSGFSGDLSEIIANGAPEGTEIVRILETDRGFETTGRGYWYRIDDQYAPEPLTAFGEGTYIVGVDIEPGTYRSKVLDSFGYWARLNDFTGDFDAIIVNGTSEGSVIVEILSSDAGFHSSGFKTWTKIE